MYDLPRHKGKDLQDILDFIGKYPFATLCGTDENNVPVATQLPLFISRRDDKMILFGHMMSHQDHHKAFLRNPNALVVFSGPHCYVSGTWYNNPFTPSTWNYMSVHVSGKLRFTDTDELKEILRKTTLHFENNDPGSSTIYDNLPTNLTDSLLSYIAGFEMEVESLKSVFKLSQDRDEISYDNIITKLSQGSQNEVEIAREMTERKPFVFKPGHQEK